MDDEIAVIDFETTGLSASADRPTEIAVAILRDFRIVDQFDSLMNPGRGIPGFVQGLTGITDEMVRRAPKVSEVMAEVIRRVGGRPIVAHNASFDRGFWEAEARRLSVQGANSFACTMRMARRLYPNAPNHRLETLGKHLSLPLTGRAHRAKADVLMTVSLLGRMAADVRSAYGIGRFTHRTMVIVQESPIREAPERLRRIGAAQGK